MARIVRPTVWVRSVSCWVGRTWDLGFEILGGGLIVAGLWMWSIIAGLISLGILLLIIVVLHNLPGILMSRNDASRQEGE